MRSLLLHLLINLSLALVLTACGGGGGSSAPPAPPVPPTITAIAPADLSSGVPLDTTLRVTFDQAIDAASLTALTFLLNDGASPVAGTVSYDSAARVGIFTPTLPLASNRTYSATLKGDVRSSAGLALGTDRNWTFTSAWTKVVGSASNEEAGGLAVDGNGNIVVAGTTAGTVGPVSAGGNDAVVIQYAATGAEQWRTQFGTSGNDFTYAVATAGSETLLAGASNGATPGNVNFGGLDALLTRLNAAGDIVWQKQFGNANDDIVWGVASDASGNSFVTGHQTVGSGSNLDQDLFVAEFDSAGNQTDMKLFSTPEQEQGRAVAIDPAGNLYVAGFSRGDFDGSTNVNPLPNPNNFGLPYSDVVLIKFAPDGSKLWSREFGTQDDDYAFGLAADSAGVVVVGTTTGVFPGFTRAGGEDIFVTRLDGSTGATVWTQQVGGSFEDFARAVVIDATGNLFVTGSSWVSLDPQSSIIDDAFLMKLGPDGTRLWSRSLGSSGSRGTGVALSGSLIYVGGDTPLDLDGNPVVAASRDLFVARFTTDGQRQ